MHFSAGEDDIPSMKARKCRNPKGAIGDIHYKPCKQFTCINNKGKMKWKKSLSSNECCLVDGDAFPVGSVIMTNNTVPLTCERVGGHPSLRIILDNMCPTGSQSTLNIETTMTTMSSSTTTASCETPPTYPSTQIELRGGSVSNEGNLFLVGKPVCDDYWDNNAADVACRMLGYSSGFRTMTSTFGSVPTDFIMDDVRCDGSEDTLLQCSYRLIDHNCGSGEGAGMMCDAITLSGGTVPSVGNLYLNGSPVCDDSWDNNDAAVACQMLGYSSGVSTGGSTYGSVPTDFIMDDVNCTGSEQTLFECNYNPSHNCGSTEGAGVMCATPELRGGSSSNEGNLFINGAPVCDDGWDNNDATVACRMLGYSSGTATSVSTYGSVPSVFMMDDVDCGGSEESLFACPFNPTHNCRSHEGAGVVCQGTMSKNLQDMDLDEEDKEAGKLTFINESKDMNP